MKVSELEGAQLDYWVAESERDGNDIFDGIWIGQDGRCTICIEPDIVSTFSPSTDWAQGGPIMEREQESVDHNGAEGLWQAHGVWKSQLKRDGYVGEGPTPLIAAMRAFVASKFGETVPD